MIARYTDPKMGSLFTEEAKFDSWLKVELLVCQEQARKGEIPREAYRKIRSRAGFKVERIEELERKVKHDLNAFLEAVGESIGAEARYLHRGLTSYDVEDTALSWRLAKACELLHGSLDAISRALTRKARQQRNTIMMGRTHGVHAEPITLGMKFLLWREEIDRHVLRLEAARKAIAVGKISGAVGTFANIDPSIEAAVCKALGLKPATISTQILQRDRHAQLVTGLAMIACSLEKFATEIRNLQRTEILEMEEYFSKDQKGSSAMPHKRNPIISEQIAGLARVMRGYAVSSMENIALWHERDLTNSSVERIILPDACILCHYMLGKFMDVLSNLKLHPEKMQENLNLTYGAVFAQRLMLAMTRKGMEKETAYRLAQRLAMQAWDSKRPLKELARLEPQVNGLLSRKDLDQCFDFRAFLKNVSKIFQRAGLV